MATVIQNGHAAPKITLYTNHLCPWAHRAHIALEELNLPYEEVIIDLSVPREQWYLDINPRGQVPSLKYSNGLLDTTITSSGIVTQFLADSHPPTLLPASHSSPTSAYTRARISYFVETWIEKITPLWFAALQAPSSSSSSSDDEKQTKSAALTSAIETEIVPLLSDAAPFFGGAHQLTLAEVQTAPFLLRLYGFADGVLLPTSLPDALDSLPCFGKWAKATMACRSVTCIWDRELVAKKMRLRLAESRAGGKK